MLKAHRTVFPDDPSHLASLITQLVALREDALGFEEEFAGALRRVRSSFQPSSRNLLHYIAVRRRDIRELQERLAALGLSSLGRSESHIFANINGVLKLLYKAAGRDWDLREPYRPPVTLAEGRAMIDRHAESLLGEKRDGRAVRVMVTMPPQAADDPGFALEAIKAGMDVARINCAHDGPREWERMAAHIRAAGRRLGRPCRIMMDLAGPKLRTGAVEPGPAVIKWSPRRNVAGQEIEPARILLTPASSPARTANAVVVPVDNAWLETLAPEDKVRLADLRGRQRVLVVTARRDDGVIAECDRTAYVGPETTLYRNDEETGARVAEVPSLEQSLIVCEGDTLILTAGSGPGRPARYGADGSVTDPARIPCTLPEIFADVKAGERVLLDDGKIATVIESVSPKELTLRVTRSAPGGVKLRADKGVNLPDSALSVKGLTQKDVLDLQTVVRLADMAALSFVSRPGDVADLQRELARLGGAHLGVVLKIETRHALERLPAILLAAMKGPSVGVMIARGDLAVECGFERLAEAQEEILWICEAAHVPVIWATQVLESLAKSGLPSRAEITDAAMSGRAECVMLNKGPHIMETIRTLDDILRRMEGHQHKKSSLLGPLQVSDLHEF